MGLLAMCAALFPAFASAGIIGGPIVNPANDHTYYLLDKTTWAASEAEAVALGGDLVTINDAAENAWVYAMFSIFDGIDRGLWIGLNDYADKGTFSWVSGQPVTYTNWAAGEPNDSGGDEDAVHIESPRFRGPFWNDRNGNTFNVGSGQWGVVEVVPEPSACVLLASGLLATGLAAVRRRRHAGYRSA
ncbi:MAG TPA: lectin-like protein [Pirellulales bacterium]|nr:lectin-like protein [Pirellulales bacterium]